MSKVFGVAWGVGLTILLGVIVWASCEAVIGVRHERKHCPKCSPCCKPLAAPMCKPPCCEPVH